MGRFVVHREFASFRRANKIHMEIWKMKINYGPGYQQLGQTIASIGKAFTELGFQKIEQNRLALDKKYKADATMAQLEMEKFATTWMQDPTNLSPEEGVEAVSKRFQEDFVSHYSKQKDSLFSDPVQADEFLNLSVMPLSTELGIKALEAAHGLYVKQTVDQANRVLDEVTTNPAIDPNSAKATIREQLDLIDSTAGLLDRKGQEFQLFGAVDNLLVTSTVESLAGVREKEVFSLIDGLVSGSYEGPLSDVYQQVSGQLSGPFSQENAQALKKNYTKVVDEMAKATKDSLEMGIMKAYDSGKLFDIGSIDNIIEDTENRNRLPLMKLKRTAMLNNDGIFKDSFTEALDSGTYVDIKEFEVVKDRKTRSELVRSSLVNLGLQQYSSISKGDPALAREAILSTDASFTDKNEALLLLNTKIAQQEDFSTDSVVSVIDTFSDYRNGRAFNFNYDHVAIEPKDVPSPEVLQGLEVKEQIMGLDEDEKPIVELYREYEEAPTEEEQAKNTTQPEIIPQAETVEGTPKVVEAETTPQPGEGPTPQSATHEPKDNGQPEEAPVLRTKEKIAEEIGEAAKTVKSKWASDPVLVQAYQEKSAERRKQVLFENMTPEQKGALAVKGVVVRDNTPKAIEINGTMSQQEMVATVLFNMHNGTKPTAEQLARMTPATRELLVEELEKIVLGVPDISDPSSVLYLTRMQYDSASPVEVQRSLASAMFASGLLVKEDYERFLSKPSGIESPNFKWLFQHIGSVVKSMYKDAPSADVEARIVDTALKEIAADPEIIKTQNRFNAFKEEIAHLVTNEAGVKYLKLVSESAKAMDKRYIRQIQDESLTQFLGDVRKGTYDYALDFGAVRDLRLMAGKTEEEIQDSFSQYLYGKDYNALTYDFEKRRVDLNSVYLRTGSVYQQAMQNTFGLKGRPHVDIQNKRWVYEDPENPGVFFVPLNLNPDEPGGMDGLKWGLFTAPRTNGVYDFSAQSGLTLVPEYLDPELYSDYSQGQERKQVIENSPAPKQDKTFLDYLVTAFKGPQANVADPIHDEARQKELEKINSDAERYEYVRGFVNGIRSELAKTRK